MLPACPSVHSCRRGAVFVAFISSPVPSFLRALSLFGKLTLVLCLSLFPSSLSSFLRFQPICFFFYFYFLPYLFSFSYFLFVQCKFFFFVPSFFLSSVFPYCSLSLVSGYYGYLSSLAFFHSFHLLSLSVPFPSIFLPVFLLSFSFYFLLSHR